MFALVVELRSDTLNKLSRRLSTSMTMAQKRNAPSSQIFDLSFRLSTQARLMKSVLARNRPADLRRALTHD